MSQHSVWRHIAPQELAKQIIACQPPCREIKNCNRDCNRSRSRRCIAAGQIMPSSMSRRSITVRHLRAYSQGNPESLVCRSMPLKAIFANGRRCSRSTFDFGSFRNTVEFNPQQIIADEIPEEFRPVFDASPGQAVINGTGCQIRSYQFLTSLMLNWISAGKRLLMPYKALNGVAKGIRSFRPR